VAACPACGKELPGEFPFCPHCAAPLTGETREQRKTVTVLFCDVTGSTELGESTDPEALRALLARYFERMKAIVESHGGTVEKFIGDAVMAVFGVPLAHEDDALRACRAAVEMRDALPGLGIAGRIGVNTGEVVTGTSERLATGDAVNVAARLEQAAEPGEVLIGEATYALVHEAAVVEPVEPLMLKGKAEPVPAYRLMSVLDAPERSHALRFVGREQELARILEAWERAREQSRCELVTVVGEPGVGKSRLVGEVLGSLGGRVVRGRCLPYGEGITYWPVVEIVRQLGSVPSDPLAAAAIRSLLGESTQGASADQIAWAFRKLLEEQAPLIVVFDDIQWGEETFLDLLEAAALLSREAPLLVFCMARPELLERRSAWPGVVRLEPLGPEDAQTLIGDEVSAELAERIAHAAGGNPLFIAEMLAMNRERADVDVPPTLKALLAARLDQLDHGERLVLERGSVEGEVFHRGAVQALVSEEMQVTAPLTALVRHELIQPDQALFPGDDGFRFRHLLIRDAAYDALSKAVRAELHARFADWLGQYGSELVELDEVVGYHLEQAARYQAELGQDDSLVALRAGDRLAAAGRRALWRRDLYAAANLLERSLALTRLHRFDVHLELDLAAAYQWEPRRAAEVAADAARRASAAGDSVSQALALAGEATYRCQFNAATVDEVDELTSRALLFLERAHDHPGLVHVWTGRVIVENGRQHFEEWAHAAKQALHHSRLAGQPRVHLFWLEMALVFGPTPADEALETIDELLPAAPDAWALGAQAVLLAMLGRFEEAWPAARRSNELFREQGSGWGEERMAAVASLAGDHETASAHGRALCDWMEERDLFGFLSTFAPRLGRDLCALGRYDEAELLAVKGRELGQEDDLATQIIWRQVLALVHAHRGEHEEAARLAREAVDIAEQREALNWRGDALCDLAQVCVAAGRHTAAVTALQDALDRFGRKKNLAMVAQVQPRLHALQNELAAPGTPKTT
jgi:class 3 adenylate cyclase/tetratricopeptide (TPR) repeat protein